MEENKNGYVGKFVGEENNSLNGEINLNNANGIFPENNNIKENADSFAGGMAINPGINPTFNPSLFENGETSEKSNGYVGSFVSSNDSTNEKSKLPAKVGLWAKIKNFLFQEVSLNQEVIVKLTPKEEKVLTEVHDFLFQKVSFKGIKDFLFQDITFGKKSKNK